MSKIEIRKCWFISTEENTLTDEEQAILFEWDETHPNGSNLNTQWLKVLLLKAGVISVDMPDSFGCVDGWTSLTFYNKEDVQEYAKIEPLIQAGVRKVTGAHCVNIIDSNLDASDLMDVLAKYIESGNLLYSYFEDNRFVFDSRVSSDDILSDFDELVN